jgi:hypothetical protein
MINLCIQDVGCTCTITGQSLADTAYNSSQLPSMGSFLPQARAPVCGGLACCLLITAGAQGLRGVATPMGVDVHGVSGSCTG